MASKVQIEDRCHSMLIMLNIVIAGDINPRLGGNPHDPLLVLKT